MPRVLLLAAFAIAACSQTPGPIETEIAAVFAAREAGDFAGAAQHRETARQLLMRAPQSELAGDVAALYLDAERTAEGRRLLRIAIEAQPDQPSLRRALAESLEGEGNILEARAVLTRRPGTRRQLDNVRLTSWSSIGVPADSPAELTFSPVQAAVIDARACLRDTRLDDAFALGLQAVAAGFTSPDTYMFGSVPALARMLARAGARGMADQLWERLFAAAEARSVDTLEPILSLQREHIRYLMQFPDRAPSVRIALTRYRDLLVEAHGADSGSLSQVLRMIVEFEQDYSPETARMAARQLVELEVRLSGPDSLPVRHAIQLAAGLEAMGAR